MQGACRAMTACNSRRSSAGKREELAASSLQSWCPPDRSCVRRQSFSIKATRSSLPAYPSLHRPMQHTDSPDRAPQAITGSPDPFYTNELQGVVFPARLQGQALGTLVPPRTSNENSVPSTKYFAVPSINYLLSWCQAAKHPSFEPSHSRGG
jgi:hypothetical protein